MAGSTIPRRFTSLWRSTDRIWPRWIFDGTDKPLARVGAMATTNASGFSAKPLLQAGTTPLPSQDPGQRWLDSPPLTVREGSFCLEFRRVAYCGFANPVRNILIPNKTAAKAAILCTSAGFGDPFHKKKSTERPLRTVSGITNWSLTSLQQRLLTTGGRLVKHARYDWLLLAERHRTRRLFGSMVRRIDALATRWGRGWRVCRPKTWAKNAGGRKGVREIA